MTRAAGRDHTTATRPDAPARPAVSYHCVCGESVELDVRTGGRCDCCGRRYAAEVARVAASETIRMPSPFEEPIEAVPATAPLGDAFLADAPRRAISPGDDAPTVVFPDTVRVDVPLPADRRLGHFRVVSRLGRGGMGDVFRALDESLQRYVALKVLRPGADGSTGPSGLPRLLQEARAQARVNHPGVVHIYYVSPDPERPFLAMELVGGSTLADRLKSRPLPYAVVIDVALQIARALRHAARYDVVHGDIKPGNILLAGDGGVKLGDFGLARRLSKSGDGPAGPITGTPHYLPPEIVAGAEPDIRSDMYALGVMLFEMTFGRRPYTVETGTLLDQIEAHRSAPPEFPDPWPVDLPEGWREILERLLRKDPAGRYQTHDELIADLERVRPVDLPRAGRFNRAIAWAADLFLAWAAEVLLLTPVMFLAMRGGYVEDLVVSVALTAAGGLILVGASWLQAAWTSSPGKALLQLRIVDRHGLTPGRSVLAGRMTLQLLPAWGMVLGNAVSLVLGDFLGMGVTVGAMVASAVDASVAFVRRDGRSLHDFLFRTRVVLDTRTEPDAD